MPSPSSQEEEPLWYYISSEIHPQVPKVDCAGSLEASVQLIDRHIQKADAAYDSVLSEPLLPDADPRETERRLLLEGEGLDLPEGTRDRDHSGPLALKLPVATCILSASYDWPFDVHESKDALLWTIQRKIEASILRSLPQNAAFARFPRPLEASSGVTSAATVFGPFSGSGLKVDLCSYEKLAPEVARLSVARRSKWLHYIFRQSGPLPVNDFPPLSHVVGTMVEHREFTDEVAMDVYGVFGECDVLVDTAPAIDDKASTSTTNGSGAVRLSALNGTTVLFMACLLLHDEESVQKLLDMEVTGLMILRDMADHGLGWIIESREARTIISRWVDSDGLHDWGPQSTPRLSLLLHSWLRRPVGPLSAGEIVTPWRLLADLRDLTPRDDQLSVRTGGATQKSARSGLFHGVAAGSAAALYIGSGASRPNDSSPSSSNDPSAAEARVAKWIQGLVKRAGVFGGSEMFARGTVDALEAHLQQELEGLSEAELDQLEVLDNSVARSVNDFKVSVRGFDKLAFMENYHRAFLVAVTSGRIQVEETGALTWHAVPYATEVLQGYLQRMPPPGPVNETPAPTGWSHWIIWAVVITALCVAASGALLWPSSQSNSEAQPILSQAMASDSARVGLGVVQYGFKAGEAMHVKEGEQVYILKARFNDWYKVENVNGDVGLVPMHYIDKV